MDSDMVDMLSGLKKKTVPDDCVLKISSELYQFDWKELGLRLLEKSKQDVDDINSEEKTGQLKRDKMLMKWKEQQGSGATYGKLIDAFIQIRNKAAAERVLRLAIDNEILCQDHLEKISLWDFDWKSICQNEQDEMDIDGTEQQKRKEALMKWKKHQGTGATYGKLINTLGVAGINDATIRVIHLAATGSGELPLKSKVVQDNCGCHNCDFKDIISKGCPQPRNSFCKYLDTSALNKKEEDILLLQLKEDADTIFNQWTIVVGKFDSWMEAIPLEHYKKILIDMLGITSAKKVYMLSDKKKEIMEAKGHLECSTILSSYYSWFNYSILEKVVLGAESRTHKDPSDFLSYLQSYVNNYLQKFCRRNIFQCPAPSSMSSTHGTIYFVLKLTDNLMPDDDTISGEKIAIFKAQLMKVFEVEDYSLTLRTVGKGCVWMVYSMPLCIYSEVFPLDEDQCKSLSDLGVTDIITKDEYYKKRFGILEIQLEPCKYEAGTEKKDASPETTSSED